MVEWVKESGDVRRDAAYIALLPTEALRARELKRLARIHGKAHGRSVEDAVAGDWAGREAGLPPLPLIEHENPRLAALSAVGGKGGM
ncbi:hypothetical protein [Chromobacterium vaccinii]|uniref:hypothetical protein n=1 Tax=Chromobacterium vaccinii TaxID=1108595 RepID=UPI000617A93D|nr:hypothetical protein [Chromobacterium vaccinii]